MSEPENILEVRNLTIGFDTEQGRLVAADGVSFTVAKGRTLGIVGESGSGKSVTSLALMRLLPQPGGKIISGEILFRGEDLSRASPARMCALRGRSLSMVFQEPMSALNPLHSIGKQLRESLELHTTMSAPEIDARCVELLRQVGIPAPEERMRDLPHRLSGGMRQRIVIAMALACDPELLICDEPTSALDVTVQAQILELIATLRARSGMAAILITHDLGVIAENCDDVAVMYAGRIVEHAPVKTLFQNPLHAYTRALLRAIPRPDSPRKSRLETIEGLVPTLAEMRPGCRFAPRSGRPYTDDDLNIRPPFVEVSPGHRVEASRVCVDAAVLAAAGIR